VCDNVLAAITRGDDNTVEPAPECAAVRDGFSKTNGNTLDSLARHPLAAERETHGVRRARVDSWKTKSIICSRSASGMEREETRLFHEHLKRERLKRTSQRDLILDVFLDTEGHVSSEDLYALVKSKDPSVGFTTVYRTLKLLKESGLARELEFHDGRILYEHEYKHTHHDHMICTSCGALIEFYSEEIEKLQDQITRKYRFKPLHHSHRIFGICASCQKSEKSVARAGTNTA